MRRDDLADALLDEHAEDGYLFPAYDDYCFANVPDTALSVLGADARRPLPGDVFDGVETADVDHVAVVLVDGYGFEQWRRDQADVPLLAGLAERGTVTPLTSTFPSETPAAITTVQTGRQPVEHGVLGWFQYHADCGVVAQTLPFTTRDGAPLDEACPGTDASWLLADGETAYERAAAAGVDAHAILPHGIPEGKHSQMTLRGADTTGYGNAAELAYLVRERLEAAESPTYCYGYLPQVDAAGHRDGTGSDYYRGQLAMVTECVRRELVDNLDPDVAERTLLVVTADHGHVDTVPAENVDVESLDGVTRHLARNRAGDPIPAVGNPRQLQFHVRDGHVEALRESVEAQLDCVTFDREEIADANLFGDCAPSETFEERVPDLLVVPRDVSVWYDDEMGELDLVGVHGGLHPREMLVPFAAARVDQLQ